MTLARGHHTTDAPFTKNFRDTIKQVLKRLFRVYAHMYYHHFDKIRGLGEEAHINTCFQVQAPFSFSFYAHHWNCFAGNVITEHPTCLVLSLALQHFFFFVDEFKLIDKRDMLPLEDLTANLCLKK
jgi:MOB kinase activator 1